MNVKEDRARLLRRLVCSRSGWKRRVAEKQDLIRSLRVKARDLETSRSFWKQRARTAEAAIRLLSADAADSTVSTTLESQAVIAACAVGER
jgi:hypothetical protein